MSSRSTWRKLLNRFGRRAGHADAGRRGASTFGGLDVVLTDPSLVPDDWGSTERDRPDYAVTDYDVRSLDGPLDPAPSSAPDR